MHTKKVLLVKYGELSLRKGNRKLFEHALLDTIRANLKPLNNEHLRVSREQGRFLIEDTSGDLDTASVLPLIRRIFGIAGFCHAVKTTMRNIDDLCEVANDFFAAQIAEAQSGFEGTRGYLHVPPEKRGVAPGFEGTRDHLHVPPENDLALPASRECSATHTCPRQKGASPPEKRGFAPLASFKVETKRSDKNYPLTSTEVSAEIGAKILTSAEKAGTNLKVDVHTPDITLWVEIRNDVYFYITGERGEGGLPYGLSGKGVLLLSGGFDSPVAGYLAARRGVEIVAVYFHSPPFVSERAADKVKDIASQLAKYTSRVKLCVLPFTETQVFLKENTPHEKLTIFLKRAMLHIASRLADRERALCLITGDAVGQVASQTIHSLAAVESAAAFPVLRPLAASDKQEIMDTAKRIGTYEISARPYEDCCTVFVARHPENKPNFRAIERMESRIFAELSPIMDNALNNAEFFDII
ncbi:MAG: tRNA 4-thiouridine(8) synthase ThiI [Defluviitaleaceae bacterium]|nr:tRNA 4-thiouridine(8) synthase ThiI [Defluviitaleaceae bacterium]